jgi:hypothetical protein
VSLEFALAINDSAVQRVSLQTLQGMAQQTGNPHAGRRDMVGVTVPHISVDQHELNYHRETVWPAQERVQFSGGVLWLFLTQTIYLLATLDAKAFAVWRGHEMLHVSDNLQIFNTALEPALRSDTTLFRPLFEQQHWFPIDVFATLESGITQAVEIAYQRLTAQAARRRDTTAEYRMRLAMAGGQQPEHAPARERAHGRR